MASSSRSVPDDLDSTVLRHQVQRYFNELSQEGPLNMEFLSMKRKPASSAVTTAMRTSTFDSHLPKKMCFDSSVAEEISVTADSSSFARKGVADSYSQSYNKPTKVDMTAQYEQKISEKQAKVLELQQKIIQTEMKFNTLLTTKDQLDHDLSNLKDTCRTKIKHYEDKIENLQIEIKQLHLKNDRLAKENIFTKEAMDQLKLACAEEKISCNKELSRVEQKMIDMQLECEDKIRGLEKNLEKALWEANKHQMEAEEAKNQLKLKERVASSPSDHITVIEQQRQVILEMENALFAQRATFSQSQEAKLTRIPQLEKELAHLHATNQLYRETAANELLLKEQISALQESVQRYKDQCQAIPDLQGELKKMASHLREWESMAGRLFDANSLAQVQAQVENMRRKELKLVDDIGNLQIELNSLNRKNLTLRDKIEALNDVSKTKLDLEDRVRKLERKLIVVQKDRDHYRTINEMYENEMTRVGGPATVSMETKQINELERLLEEYRELVSMADTSPKANQETVTKLNQEKEQLTKEVAELNLTIKHLKAQLEFAESRGIASDTRILHFTNNPLDNVRRKTLEQLSQLEKENESLRERVRLMEAGYSQNLTLLVEDHFEQGCTPERFRELEEKLKSSEMKNQRMEEVFRKYCSDFRRGIFELFGYQVDNDECGNFKLTSVFSESSADYLSFKYVGDGLMVMDSPYLHTIDDLVQLHINNQKSIPVFLSALTVELYSRQSINSSAYPSVMATPS